MINGFQHIEFHRLKHKATHERKKVVVMFDRNVFLVYSNAVTHLISCCTKNSTSVTKLCRNLSKVSFFFTPTKHLLKTELTIICYKLKLISTLLIWVQNAFLIRR